MAGSLILPAENLEEPKNPKSIKRLIKGAGRGSKNDSAIEHTVSHYRQHVESSCASDPGLKVTN